MKPITLFLTEHNQGSTLAALSADLDELLKTVQATGRSGKLQIAISVTPAVRNANGGAIDKVSIAVDRKLALPKPEQPADFFYLTEDGETTRNHPRQQELTGLRDVSQPTTTDSLKEATR